MVSHGQTAEGDEPYLVELHVHGVIHIQIERLPRWLLPSMSTFLSVIGTWMVAR